MDETYSVQIERAIYSCEIKPCSPSEWTDRGQKWGSRCAPIAVADELTKLKLLQNRRAIDVFEFNDQKKTSSKLERGCLSETASSGK